MKVNCYYGGVVVLAIFNSLVVEGGVEIRLLGLRLRFIPFSDIAEVSQGSRGTMGEVWTIFKWWGLVTITKKAGCLKYVTVAPRHPQRFVEAVESRIKT